MKDGLDRKIYAAKISDEIAEHYKAQKNGKESESIVFAISGKWGEGKTELLNFLQPNLEAKGFTVARFNPWKYSQEDITLKRAFLGSIKEQLHSHINLDDLYFDRTKTTLNFDWRFVIRWTLFGSFLYFGIFPTIFGLSIFDWLTTSDGILTGLINLPLVKPLLTLILIPIVLEIITISRRGANVSTAEEFEEKFIDLLKGKEKVVIFIDDLDRCTPKTVKVILDSLKTFFQHPECSYIITGDHTVIERYAAEELNPNKEQLTGKDREEGRRFLKKLFDVYWRLPLATPKVFKGFISGEIKKSGVLLTDIQDRNVKTFLLDDRLFERNPRHAKRFITALKFALQSINLQSQELNNTTGNDSDSKNEDIEEQKISIKEILDNADLLAKVLLVQEKFYPIYEKLVLYPAEIANHEKSLRGGGNPEDLTIDGESILKIILEEDGEALKNYASLVTLEPQFTNIDNATIFDPTNFFSSSVATGLPSLKGPDETNFPQYLKSGQLTERLGTSLEAAPAEKRARLAQRALQVFDEGVDTEKMNIVNEGLKMASRLDEWAAQLDQWEKKLFLLPVDQQNTLAGDWWKAVLMKSPSVLSVIKIEKPVYFESLWSILEEIDKSILHRDVVAELEKVLKGDIALRPPVLRGVETFLQKFGNTTLTKDLDVQLVDPAACKVFLDSLQRAGLQDGKVADLVKRRITTFLGDFAHIDWLIANKEYLKPIGLFEQVKMNSRKWAKDLKQFTQLAEKKDLLELDENDKKAIANEIIVLIKKSANLEFLDNSNTQSFLDKEDRKACFRALKDVFGGNDEALEKRKQAAVLLAKSKSIWNGVENNDVYEFLKEIKKLKLGRVADLKEKPTEILNSWGFNDSSNK